MTSLPNLPNKYRPRTFEKVVGQSAASEELSELARSGKRAQVILHGPTGTGKTSMARILAQALLCDNRRSSGSPCLECGTCRAFELRQLGDTYVEANAATYGRAAPIEALMQRARNGLPLVLVLDEAHNLEQKAAQMLLDVLEANLPSATIVLCTTDIERLASKSEALIDRFPNKIRVPKLSKSNLVAAAEEIAALEGIEVEREVLDELAGAAGGSMRKLLQELGHLASTGELTLDAVRSMPSSSVPHVAANVVSALIDGNIREAAALGEAVVPESLRSAIEELIGDALGWTILGRVPASDASDVTALAAEVAKRALARGVTVADIWGALVSSWAPLSRPMTSSQVQVAIMRTADLLSQPASPPTDAPRATRATRRDVGIEGRYLGRADVRSLWEAASFLGQVHGLSFSLALTRKYSLSSEDTATGVTQRLIHSLRERVRRANQLTRFFWQYVHSRDTEGVAQTILAVAAPSALQSQLEGWFKDGALPDGAAWIPSRPRLSASSNASFQVDLLRRMSACLDPGVYEWDGYGERLSLLDLLKVPASMRSSLGAQFTLVHLGSSQNLSVAARARRAKEMGLISAFDEKAWDWVGIDWETNSHAERLISAGQAKSHMPRAPWAHPLKSQRKSDS